MLYIFLDRSVESAVSRRYTLLFHACLQPTKGCDARVPENTRMSRALASCIAVSSVRAEVSNGALLHGREAAR